MESGVCLPGRNSDMRNGKVIHEIPEYNGAGIYALVDGQTDGVYIGSSINVRDRIIQHERVFRDGKGAENLRLAVAAGHTFRAVLLEKVSDEKDYFCLFEKETEYIKKYTGNVETYNRAPTTASSKEELERFLVEHPRIGEDEKRYIRCLIRKRSIPIGITRESTFKMLRSECGENYAVKVAEKAKAEGTSVNAILKRALDEFLEK